MAVQLAEQQYFVFPKPTAYPVSGTWPPEQCPAWIPSLGVSLKSNQRVANDSHNLCATIKPSYLASKSPP